jgi:hypothetical protein
VNVPVVAPDAIVTVPEAGTLAAVGLSLATFTVRPLVGAGALMVTVAVAFTEPPVTLARFSVIDVIAGGLIVKVVFAEPFNVPVIVSIVVVATLVVVMLNVAVVAPAAKVTLAGVAPAAEELFSVTVI